MSIFLQDQYERLDARIVELIQENKELTNLLGQREHLKGQLKQLGEDLKSNDMSKAVQEIIELIQTKRTPEKKEKSILELTKEVLLALTKN